MIFNFTVLDAVDILLVAIILYQLYRLIRGTAALSIFIGIFLIYLFWLIVRALNMELISALVGQVIGVGAIALTVVTFLAGLGWGWQVRRDRTVVWAMGEHVIFLAIMSLFGM